MPRRSDSSDSETDPGSGRARTPRKDRLVQARVPSDLADTLKDEAERRRLTVSHLVRNVLEDAFQLVDGVVSDVDRIVNDSVILARSLRGVPQKSPDGEPAEPPPAAPDIDDLSHVYAWNEVVLHQSATCSSCGRELARGQRAHTGLSDEPSAPRAWLCGACIALL